MRLHPAYIDLKLSVPRLGKPWSKTVEEGGVSFGAPVLVAIAALLAVSRSAGAQTGTRQFADTTIVTAPAHVTESVGPVVSSVIPPGHFVGVVLDDSTGRGVEQASFTIIGRPFSLFNSDARGRFSGRLVAQRSDSLFVRAPGYLSVEMPAVMRAEFGYVAVITLKRAPPPERCKARDEATTYQPGVLVDLRDAVTGGPSYGPATLTVRDGEYSDQSTTVYILADRRYTIIAAQKRPGRYEVAVRSPDYHDWYARVETRPMEGCPGQFQPGTVTAWLVPR